MIDTWSSSVLAKIFIIDGVAESVLLRTRFIDVYLKILNPCKIIVAKIAIWLYICTQTISMQIVSGTIFIQYKSNSNFIFFTI